MCKGLAVCVNKKGVVLCEGISSHDITKSLNNIIGMEQDEFLDFEIILPNYTKPKLDLGDSVCIQVFKKNGLIDDNNKPIKAISKALNEWIKKNELFILRSFINNQGLLNCQQVKGDMNCGNQQVKGDMYCDNQQVKGDMYCGNQQVKGDMNCGNQQVKGDMDCDNQQVKGDMNCSYQKVKGDMDCDNQQVKGDIIILNMKNGSKETQKLLDEFSNSEQEVYSFDAFVKWLVKKR